MKNYHILKKAGLLMITVIAFTSCSKEQVLIKKIEGTYKIEKVVYILSTGDSVVSNPNSTMFFDDCKLKEQVAQQCKGYYEMVDQNRIDFDYLPEKDGGKELMRINIGNLSIDPYFGGSYIIENRTDNGFTLTRYTYDQYLDKIYDLRIFLKK